MKKQEFLNILQESLEGEVKPGIIADNIAYYNQFIQAEMDKGRSVDSVMDELGDPRLIAKTIINTPKDQQRYADSGNTFSTDEAKEQTKDPYKYMGNFHTISKGKFYGGLIIAAVILFLILFFVLKIFSLFLPVILVGLIIYFVVRVINR